MPARNRDKQHQVGKFHPVRQARGQRVARKVVDRYQRQARRRRKAARQHHTRQNPANQAGTCRHRDAVKIAKAGARLFQGQLDNPVQPFGMGTGSDFRDNAAKSLVQVGLAQIFPMTEFVVQDRVASAPRLRRYRRNSIRCQEG